MIEVILALICLFAIATANNDDTPSPNYQAASDFDSDNFFGTNWYEIIYFDTVNELMDACIRYVLLKLIVVISSINMAISNLDSMVTFTPQISLSRKTVEANLMWSLMSKRIYLCVGLCF
jgi:hypothetical protein